MNAAVIAVAALASAALVPSVAGRGLQTLCFPKWCPETCQYYNCQYHQCMCTDSWYTVGADKKCVLKCPADQKPVSLAGGGYRCVCKDSTQVINLSGKCVCPPPPTASPPPPAKSPPPPTCVAKPCSDPTAQKFDLSKCKCQCIDPFYKLNSAGTKCVLKCPVDQKPKGEHGKCVCIIAGQYIGPSGTCVYPPPPPICVKKPCPNPKNQHFDCKWGQCTCNDHLHKIDGSGKCVFKCPDDQTPVPLKTMMFKCECKLAGQAINPATGKCGSPAPPPSPPSLPSPPPPSPPASPPPPQCTNEGGRCASNSDCCSYDRCGKNLVCKCKWLWSSYKTCEESSFWTG